MKAVGTLRYADAWIIDELEPHACIRLKQLFQRVKKEAAPPYKFADTLDLAQDLHWFESRYRLDMSNLDRATLNAKVNRAHRKADELERITSGDYHPPAFVGIRPQDPLTGRANELRDYQRIAVDMVSVSQGLLLVDDVGLGKTWTGAATCLIPGALPAAIVCQPHLASQWANVVERFTTLKVHQIKGTRPYNYPKADVYIFRYTQLIGWADMFKPMGINAVIYDEVQELRTGTAAEKGKGAARLSHLCTYRLGLSATPIYNYGIEIWNIMRFLRRELLGPRDDFLREWAPAEKLIDPAALSSYMKANHAMLRRTKADVGKELPKVNTIIQDIGFDHRVMEDASRFARELAKRATMATTSQERTQAGMELDMKLRQATGIAKAAAIAEFIRLLVESGQNCIVGLWHREVYAILMKRLADLSPVMYSGSETPKQKDEAKRKFIDGEAKIFLMSLRSGAGLDGLQHVCSTVVIGELDWSPATHTQLIGRLDREGQKEPVTAFYLTIEEGSDPVMVNMLGLKASEQNALINDGKELAPQHTDISRLQTLIDRYLTKRAA